MRLGNVAKSFSLPLDKSKMSEIKALSPREDSSFLFVCFPKKQSDKFKDYCTGKYDVATSDTELQIMVLCPGFFTGHGQIDSETSSAENALKTLMKEDRQQFHEALEKEEVFEAPLSPGECTRLFCMLGG